MKFWVELLIDKCSCLQTGESLPGKSKPLIIIRDCLEENCKFTPIKNLLLSKDKPTRVNLVFSLLKTGCFNRRQICSIIASVFNLQFSSAKVSVYNILNILKKEKIDIKENNKKILSVE